MSERLINRMTAPLARRVMNMVTRGVVSAVNAASKMQGVQLRLLAGEIKDKVEHFEPYGFTSHPKEGSEAVVVFAAGDRSHGLCIVVSDRRYRLTTLVSGEVALYDDLGHVVKLGRSGIEVDGGGHMIKISNTPKVRFETIRVECTGNFYSNVP